MAVDNTDKEKQAFKKALRSAELGQSREQFTVGLMYANGVGVDQDFQQALHWYLKAAENGLAAAQYILGSKYAGGIGVRQDLQKAFLWYLRAGEQGHPKALFKLGKLFSSPHQDLAANFFHKAAEKGLAEAQLVLGSECLSDKCTEQDCQEALYW